MVAADAQHLSHTAGSSGGDVRGNFLARTAARDEVPHRLDATGKQRTRCFQARLPVWPGDHVDRVGVVAQ